MLSQKQLTDVCLLYGQRDHQQCRYLEEDTHGQWHCLKCRTTTKQSRDETVATFLSECKTKGVNPSQQGIPLGDNCHGYPMMKHLEQGYDVD